jgi:hypothetical protein
MLPDLVEIYEPIYRSEDVNRRHMPLQRELVE